MQRLKAGHGLDSRAAWLKPCPVTMPVQSFHGEKSRSAPFPAMRAGNTGEERMYASIPRVRFLVWQQAERFWHLLSDRDAQRLHLAIEMAAFEAQQFGGAADVVARLFNLLLNVLALVGIARLLKA